MLSGDLLGPRKSLTDTKRYVNNGQVTFAKKIDLEYNHRFNNNIETRDSCMERCKRDKDCLAFEAERNFTCWIYK